MIKTYSCFLLLVGFLICSAPLQGQNATVAPFSKDRWTDHWFLSLEGGATSLFNENNHSLAPWQRISPKIKFAFGRDFSPVFTMRMQLEGWELMDNAIGENYMAGSIDFMCNLMNLLGTYQPKRVFTLHPFVGMEAHYIVKRDSWNFGLKGGLQCRFRVSPVVDLFMEGTGHLYPPNFNFSTTSSAKGMVDLTAGIVIKFGKSSFTAVEPMDYGYVRELNYRVDQLRNRKCPEVVPCPQVSIDAQDTPCPPCPECPEYEKVVPLKQQEPVSNLLSPSDFLPEVVRFGYNKTKVESDEQLTIIRQVAYYLKAYPGQKIRVVGYADMKTGNPAGNLKVSELRAKEVRDVLVQQFGIPLSQILLDWSGDKIQPFEENVWNRAVVFVKVK